MQNAFSTKTDADLPASKESIGRPQTIAHYLARIRLEDGGVVRAVLDTCELLAEAGHRVVLLTMDNQDVPSTWRVAMVSKEGVKLVRVDGWGRTGLPAAAVEALRSADVVHLHTPWDPRNVAVAKHCKAHGVPYVVTPHGMLDDWPMAQKSWKKRLYWWAVGRRLFRHAACVHFTAEGERQQSRRWIAGAPSLVVPCPVDFKPYRELPSASLAEAQFEPLRRPGAKLLFLSRLHPKKGPEQLIDAATRLQQEETRVQVLFAGPGEPAYIETLRQRATAAGMGEAVHFLGMVRGEAKLALYRACDLFVLPTHQENFGLVLIEAMACGLPVVTTRGVDIWPDLAEGGAAIADRTPDALANMITELLEDRDALKAKGEAGRAWALNRYAPQRLATEYAQLYALAAEGSDSAGAAS